MEETAGLFRYFFPARRGTSLVIAALNAPFHPHRESRRRTGSTQLQ
jgi:hypothetical protein